MSKKSLLWNITTLLVLFQLSGPGRLDAALVFPEQRRVEVIEKLEMHLAYVVPERNELRLLPDPFVFGRTVAEDEPEQAVQGIEDDVLLDRVASTLSENILGYQSFGDRSLFPTRDFGLLKEGDTVTIELPDLGGQAVSVEILSPSRSGFTIRLNENLETFVPANNTSEGLRRAGPRNQNPPPNTP